MKVEGVIGWGSGGCKPRIVGIIKLKKSGSGWWGTSLGSGRGGGWQGVRRMLLLLKLVTQELKVLIKEHITYFTIYNSKIYENGSPQPPRVIENERKFKEIGKKL